MTTDLDVCLRERFGLDRFRPGQREVIETVLGRRDCLCVMPTGGGKSLCYQLPSMLLEGVTLVVSPLIALMKDQVDSLVKLGLRATLINSTVDTATQNERIAAMERGEFDLVYVAPERFRSARFSEVISRTQVALMAIDEAHCISEWGHDFRPDYTRLGRARRRLGNPPTIALTATATDHVRRDICEQLELSDPRVFITGFDRPNLRYEVRYASSDATKQSVLMEVLRTIQGAGIVYCSSRKRCEEVASFLTTELRRKSLVYHAGLQGEDRRRAQDVFMQGKDHIVVATNAFGMGVDKPDIRFVIHYNIPGTLEAYYQEAGRAGRDGAESWCLLLYSPGDRHIQEFFIESEYPSRDVLWAIYNFLARQPEDPIELTQEQIKARLNLQISEMGVGASLKLLESAGALERLRPRENMAIVRIDSDVSLVGLLPTHAAIQRRVLSALERLVALTPGDDTYFSPHHLSQRLQLEPTQFSRAMHELCEKLPMEYVPPFRGNAVRMLDRDRTITTLGIDFKRLEARKQREYEKLEQMVSYAQGRQCRRRTILAYFGDNVSAKCGHCDICQSSAPLEPSKLECTERISEIVGRLLAGVARATGRGHVSFGKRIIATMLAGKNGKAIQRWRLDKLDVFGSLAEFSPDEIVLLLDQAIEARWLQVEELERFKAVISLSEEGRKVLSGQKPASHRWRLPEDLWGKLRQEPPPLERDRHPRGSKSARVDEASPRVDRGPAPDRELLKRLKSRRDQWAIELGIPVYMVLANGVLEDLARERPRTPDALLEVKGMGPAKVAKYGDQLLEILRSPAEIGSAPEARRTPSKPLAKTPDVARSHAPPVPVETEPSDASLARSGSGRPSHYWTWRLLERGFTQSECAIIRNLDDETILQHAVAAVREGRHVPLDAFLPEEQIAILQTMFGETSSETRKAKASDLPDGIRYEHLQLYWGRVRSGLT